MTRIKEFCTVKEMDKSWGKMGKVGVPNSQDKLKKKEDLFG